MRSVKGALTEAELEHVYNWSRDEEMLRWTGGKPSDLTLDEFRAQLRRARWRPQSNQRIFYILTRSGELIGRVGLFTIDWAKKEGELGILIGKEYWSKHYGRESIRLFAQHVFATMPITRIYLGTFEDNIRAQRAFASCGFRVLGTTKRFAPIEGQAKAGLEMELTQQDLTAMDRGYRTRH